MNDLQDLYQEVILDHYKRPRNHGRPERWDAEADGHNPLCGDRVHVYVTLEGDRVAALAFEGAGCAISTASASLMSEAVEGKSLDEVEALFRSFVGTLKGETPSAPVELGKLEVLQGVRQYPVRIKCATLAWHALHAALERQEGRVTTE